MYVEIHVYVYLCEHNLYVQVLGEMALLSGCPASASVVADLPDTTVSPYHPSSPNLCVRLSISPPRHPFLSLSLTIKHTHAQTHTNTHTSL